jgi:hypothetical protein
VIPWHQQQHRLAVVLEEIFSSSTSDPYCTTFVWPAGKTYIGVQLVRLLLANTRSSSAAAASLQSNVVKSSIPWSQRPEIGPILVLCYTNHALDAFLLDLVNCGITEGIIRVGRR